MKFFTFALLLIMTTTASQQNTLLAQNQLSAEGQARKASHDFLFNDFIKGKKSVFKGNEPTRVLDEIVIWTGNKKIRGEMLLDLPVGSQRVASMFRYIVLRGEHLDTLEGLTMLPYAPNSNLPQSTKQSKIYRVKVPSMPIPTESMPAIQLKSKCESGRIATITEIAFNSQAKLATKFDDIPYRNLGAEFPRESVTLNIDIQKELSLDGHIDLEREKFCRYYAAPGNLDSSFENWALERNFLPGRQITKLQPALVVGYSNNQPKLAERSDKAGAADLSFFEKYDGSAPLSNAIQPFKDIKYAMCLNDYPEFMSVKKVGRGTPLVEHFDDAAELAGAFIADQIKDAGRTATWWEVKNESTIKSEWDYHWNKEIDAWALMADFHNRVADSVHKQAPGTLVGGPSSAWMQLQVSDFGLYRNQVKFMDLTKDHVDFYSHHFYEDFGTVGAWERREEKYTNYLLGRMEAILDMIGAHMHETQNVKPILITECGSLQPGRGPSDYWLRLRSYSAYMHKLMQRPEQIDLAVPFVFLSIPWNPQSGNTAFIPKEGKRNNSPMQDCESTPVKDWFELWRDFDGRRLPVSFNHKWLDVTAVHSKNRVQLAITNMGGRRLSISATTLTGEWNARSISQRRLYYQDGEIKYEDAVLLKSIGSIPVDVEETTIVTIEMERPLEIKGTVRRKSFYAAGTAVKSESESAKSGFTIDVENCNSIKQATLVVGNHRNGGFGGDLAGTWNGKPIKLTADWANEFNNLFASIELNIPVEDLENSNLLKLDSRAGLTITSVHLKTDEVE